MVLRGVIKKSFIRLSWPFILSLILSLYLGNVHFVVELQFVHALPDVRGDVTTQLSNEGQLVLLCVALETTIILTVLLKYNFCP